MNSNTMLSRVGVGGGGGGGGGVFPGEVTCLHAERFGVTVKLWTTHLRGINWPALHSNLQSTPHSHIHIAANKPW